MVDQLASDLGEAEGWVGFEDLAHDWQDLPFDQGPPFQWRDRGRGTPFAIDVVPDYLSDGILREPGFLNRF